MAHPQAEAVEAPAPVSVEEKAAAFEDYLFEGDEEQEEPIDDQAPEEEQEGEEVELEIEEGDEQETPAIDAPVSLNAEEKEVFAQLSDRPEAQQAWAASETRRNLQVQEATTKASNAQRAAEAAAASADAEAKRQYAEQLDQFVAAFEPQAPDPVLAQHDPARYIAQKAQFDAAKAQHDELVQRVKAVKNDADTEAHQAFLQQRDRELMAIPEVANPETRQNYLDTAFNMAEAMGYDKGELAKTISAAEVQKLVEIAGWKEKAAKYDSAMKRQMQKVRAAKGKTLRPNAAPQGKTQAGKASGAWDRVKQAGGNKARQADAFADYLEATGIL